jgi:cytochrome d ubiquinol oxidase subunit I
MRTKDAVSLHGAPEVGLTLVLFILIYCAVFGTGIAYLLRQIRIGPVPGESNASEEGGPGHEKHPMRPLSVVTGPEEDVTGDGKA